VDEALKPPQFYLLWGVLCLNVTAGIGVLGQASAMSQEMFPGKITAAAAAGFVGLLSLFNMIGRFFWASTSDYIGRRNTYMIFFALGMALYAAVPWTGNTGSVRDVFGVRYVGAIHGRLLTAWSTAGVLGPVLVNYIREYQINNGVPKADAYSVTMYIMAGLLLVGFILNWLMTPVDEKHYMTEEELKASMEN